MNRNDDTLDVLQLNTYLTQKTNLGLNPAVTAYNSPGLEFKYRH